MAYCTNCGKEPLSKKFCDHCGEKMNKTHRYCAWCGAAIEDDLKACPKCDEPKKSSSVIGNFFRRLLGAVIIFVGTVFTLSGLISLPEMILPALVVVLIGIFVLPFSRKMFYKMTHENLQIRKITKWVAPVALTVILFAALGSCVTIQNYETAMEQWEETAYAAAMYHLVDNPDYKDAAEYIERFETEVVASLTESPWCSDFAYYTASAQQGTRWNYQFNADGTVLRRAQRWSGSQADTHSLLSYDDLTLPYSFFYEINDETGVYEACIRIGTETNYHDYVLGLGIKEEKIVILGFWGDIEVEDQSLANRSSILSEQYFGRDTSMPD